MPVIFLCLPFITNGQAVHITGTFIDGNSTPIESAVVEYLQSGNHVSARANTDDKGNFELTILPSDIWNKSGIIPICPDPNPFSDSTRFSVFLTSPGVVTLYDKQGKKIMVWELERPGEHRITWGGLDREGEKVAAGVYTIQVKAEGYEDLKDVVYLAAGKPSPSSIHFRGDVSAVNGRGKSFDMIRFRQERDVSLEMKIVFPLADTSLGTIIWNR
jgi:hypothetical protein